MKCPFFRIKINYFTSLESLSLELIFIYWDLTRLNHLNKSYSSFNIGTHLASVLVVNLYFEAEKAQTLINALKNG